MEILIYGNDRFMLAPPDLTLEIERLKEELLVERERTLRALADFRNYRRRVEHDVNLLVEVSQQGTMDPVLTVINDMQDHCTKNNLSVIYIDMI
jgi:molecular chaperone GrpE (heat shock protein)